MDLKKIIDDFLLENVVPVLKTSLKEVYEPVLYSLLNGGKRIRPILFLLISGFDSQLSKEEKEEILYTASAIETMHTYSLIHDDLPAMDNDLLRRGKPTCHIAYPEWAAILAGDTLNTFSFYLLSLTRISVEQKVKILSSLAGIQGMILGQALDLSQEKKNYQNATEDFIFFQDYLQRKKYYKILSPFIHNSHFIHLMTIHYHKTAALFRATVELAMISSQLENNIEFNANIKNSYIEYAEILGLLFQIIDDLLDETGDEKIMGKSTRKDQKLGKLTFPFVVGIENTKKLANEFSKYASSLASNFIFPFPRKDYRSVLKYFPYYIVKRQY